MTLVSRACRVGTGASEGSGMAFGTSLSPISTQTRTFSTVRPHEASFGRADLVIVAVCRTPIRTSHLLPSRRILSLPALTLKQELFFRFT